MKFVELFAGAGGMACGLKQAGHEPICAVEIDPDAAETYRRNIGDHVWEQDVRKVVSILPEADMLVGGPPCQGFSTAGAKRAEDPRNQLFQAFLGLQVWNAHHQMQQLPSQLKLLN